MIDHVADHVHQRVGQLLDDIAVEFHVFALRHGSDVLQLHDLPDLEDADRVLLFAEFEAEQCLVSADMKRSLTGD